MVLEECLSRPELSLLVKYRVKLAPFTPRFVSMVQFAAAMAWFSEFYSMLMCCCKTRVQQSEIVQKRSKTLDQTHLVLRKAPSPENQLSSPQKRLACTEYAKRLNKATAHT